MLWGIAGMVKIPAWHLTIIVTHCFKYKKVLFLSKPLILLPVCFSTKLSWYDPARVAMSTT